jgi:hypothetical protein
MKNHEQNSLQRPSNETTNLHPNACRTRKIRRNPKSSRNRLRAGGITWQYPYAAADAAEPYSLDEKPSNHTTYEQKQPVTAPLAEENCQTTQ